MLRFNSDSIQHKLDSSQTQFTSASPALDSTQKSQKMLKKILNLNRLLRLCSMESGISKSYTHITKSIKNKMILTKLMIWISNLKKFQNNLNFMSYMFCRMGLNFYANVLQNFFYNCKTDYDFGKALLHLWELLHL